MKKLIFGLFVLMFISTLAHAVPRYDNLSFRLITGVGDALNSSNVSVHLINYGAVKIHSDLPNAFWVGGIRTNTVYYLLSPAGLDYNLAMNYPFRYLVKDQNDVYHVFSAREIGVGIMGQVFGQRNIIGDGLSYYPNGFNGEPHGINMFYSADRMMGGQIVLGNNLEISVGDGVPGQHGSWHEYVLLPPVLQFKSNSTVNSSADVLAFYKNDSAQFNSILQTNLPVGYVSPISRSILQNVSENRFVIQYYLGEIVEDCQVNRVFELGNSQVVKGTSISVTSIKNNDVKVRISKVLFNPRDPNEVPVDVTLQLNVPVQHFGLTYVLTQITAPGDGANNARRVAIKVSNCEKGLNGQVKPLQNKPNAIAKESEFIPKSSSAKPDFVSGLVGWVKNLFGD